MVEHGVNLQGIAEVLAADAKVDKMTLALAGLEVGLDVAEAFHGNGSLLPTLKARLTGLGFEPGTVEKAAVAARPLAVLAQTCREARGGGGGLARHF